MPQFDRYKKRTLNIEFIAAEDFSQMPYPERYTLIFVTAGYIKGILNQRPIKISAPGILCLYMDDTLEIIEKDNIAAQSFCFHPDFLKSNRITETPDTISNDLRIKTGLSLFHREGTHNGVPFVSENAYPKLFEWFFILGTEVYAQSDALWACRIKKYLIQILGMLEDLGRRTEQSPVELVLEYIFTNYSQKIILEDLTNCAHLNRVSLNKLFQERCGSTAMGYLLQYRLKVAGDLLTHTNMSLNEIARATGFEYDTYFIKQFTAKRGMSPGNYRNTTREHAALV